MGAKQSRHNDDDNMQSSAQEMRQEPDVPCCTPAVAYLSRPKLHISNETSSELLVIIASERLNQDDIQTHLKLDASLSGGGVDVSRGVKQHWREVHTVACLPSKEHQQRPFPHVMLDGDVCFITVAKVIGEGEGRTSQGVLFNVPMRSMDTLVVEPVDLNMPSTSAAHIIRSMHVQELDEK